MHLENKERRKLVLQKLRSADKAVTGRELAAICQVSRQIIVSDIAMLRAEGEKILATSQGYLLEQEDNTRQELDLYSPTLERLVHELELIVDNGGIVRGAGIEYGPYGEICCSVNFSSRRDIHKWMTQLKEEDLQPLSLLAGGYHTLDIEVRDEEGREEIRKLLGSAGYFAEK